MYQIKLMGDPADGCNDGVAFHGSLIQYNDFIVFAEMEAKEFKEFARDMINYVTNYLENIRDRWVKFSCSFCYL